MHPGAAGTYGSDPGDEQQRPAGELSRVEAWRLEQLLAAGYPVYLAEKLAASSTVDLHRAVDLVKAGCRYVTAAEILL